jgi:ATP-dependent Clp protease adaptor protein ClpS
MEQTTEQTVDNIGITIPRPNKYQVVLHNDDHTPMEFVIELLKGVYKHTQHTAEEITQNVHEHGKGVAGIYYYEMAEQKVSESLLFSRTAGYPLSFDIEEA